MSDWTSPADIRPDHLEIVQNILREHLPAAFKVWVFGSRANWTTKDSSDLDLAVEGADVLDYMTMVGLEVAFEESDLPYTVDVVDLNAVSPNFREIIEGQRVLLPISKDPMCIHNQWPKDIFAQVLAEPVRNGVYKKKEFHGSGVKIVNMGELFAYPRLRDVEMRRVQLSDSEQQRFNVQAGDLLFARRSLVAEGAGKCSVVLEVNEPTGFESSIIRGRPDPKKVDSLFLYYFFNSPHGLHTLDTIRRQVAVAGITSKDLAQLTIPVPPLPEQRAIAHILGTLDDKIELNRQINQTLEEMARAIFQDWFVEFGPVRAKLEGTEPYLPPELWNLFPDRLVDSELGEIPEGWEVKELGDVVDVVGGTTPSTKIPEYWDGGTHCWATPKDLSSLSVPVLLDTERKVTDSGLKRIGSGLQPIGTVLLSSRAPIGYLAINEIPVAINQGFIAIQPRKGLSNLFLLYWCKSSLDEIMSHANGSTFLEISKSSFRQIPIMMPSQPVLDAYHLMVSNWYAGMVFNEHSSCALAAQRDALLPRLVSGEVRVEEYENRVEAIV